MSDVLEIAKTIETEGRAQYLWLAESTVNREVTGVFRFLADEEEKHLRMFERMQKNLPVEISEKSDILKRAKSVLKSISVDNVPPRFGDAESSYQKALDLEIKSVEFYEKLVNDKAVSGQAGVIALVLGEERRHVRLMEALLELVRSPKRWLENAEWNHLDEY
jgi:rubrerythrin